MYLITPRAESQYIAGRNIGDEYRYIIDRKFARKYPGNMLERPSLLLNPWAIRSTETGQQEAQAGEAFGGKGRPRRIDRRPWRHSASRRRQRRPISPISIFWPKARWWSPTSCPDKNGVIEIKRADLGPHQQLLFVAVDPQNTASRIVTLPEAKADYLDLRLAKGLDLKRSITRSRS